MMSKVYYDTSKPILLPTLGVPYTWGIGVYFYVRVADKVTVCLNDSSVYNKVTLVSEDAVSIMHTTDMPEFRYATELEVK